MSIPIVLYDENHERVGETYHRRAKQLVRSGRAVWLEGGKSLQMAPYQAPEIPALPSIKEDVFKMTESIYTNNGMAPEAPETPPTDGVNELRMYLARQNVARKRNLVKNIVAYALAWVLLLSIGMSFTSHSTSHRRGVTVGNEAIRFTTPFGASDGVFLPSNFYLRESLIPDTFDPWPEVFVANAFDHSLEAYIIENVAQYITGIFDYVERGMRSAPFEVITPLSTGTAWHPHTQVHYNNGFLHFLIGIMCAWGIWILARGTSIFRQHRQIRPRKVAKPDPVVLEYQRLSAMDEYK
ncbi:MAG: hypothetical protein FWC77_04930 [Defluviitaleaceae bacterium]|nr:hypothetical protein [Defluviitaleaceae bacterium]